jgi:hypothetical protein
MRVTPRTRRGPRAPTLTLTNLALDSPSGTLVRMPQPIRLSAVVGDVFG